MKEIKCPKCNGPVEMTEGITVMIGICSFCGAGTSVIWEENIDGYKENDGKSR